MELVLNIFMAVAAALTLMLSFARATTEHRALVLTWAGHVAILVVCSLVVVWFVRAILVFAYSTEPLTRPAVFNFALSFFNALAYASFLMGYLTVLKGKKEQTLRETAAELLKKREAEACLEAAREYTDRQISMALGRRLDSTYLEPDSRHPASSVLSVESR